MILLVNMQKSILFRNTYRSGRTLRKMISTEIMIVFISGRAGMRKDARRIKKAENYQFLKLDGYIRSEK